MVTNKRRWRLWTCIQVDPNSAMKMRRAKNKMRREIKALQEKGFKAKRGVTRLEHLTSGHFHIWVLCTFNELCKLAGIPNRKVKK